MGWASRCWSGLVAVALVGCGAAGSASRPPDGSPDARSAPTLPPPAASAAGAPAASPATLEKVVMALPVASGTLAPHVLAQQKGFFREEGLDVELPIMRTNLISAAMTAGEVDYDGSISPAVRNALSGVPTRLVMATVNKSTRRVMAAPGIQSMEQLRGKTIAIPGIGGGLYNSGVLALEAYGIDPRTEVIWLPVPGLAERYLTLQQGIAQGSVFSGPEVPRAQAMGFPTLLDLNAVAPLPESGIATSVTKLETQRDQIRRVLRAVIRALQYLKTDRQGSLPVFMQFLSLTPEEAGEAYDGIAHAYSDDGTLSEQSMRFTLDSEKQQLDITEDVPLSRVADFGPLYEVLRELGITPAPGSAR